MTTFEQIIKKGSLCFDIGANDGNKSNLFLSLGAKVVCVEPQINCVKRLQSKFSSNPDVTIINKAVGTTPGKIKLFLASSHTLSTVSQKVVSLFLLRPPECCLDISRCPIRSEYVCVFVFQFSAKNFVFFSAEF